MNQAELLTKVLKNNTQAVQLCTSIGFVSQIWDDLIDKDKVVPPDQINAAFWECLITIPVNPFYRTWEQQLRPMLQLIICDWMDSTKLEASQNPNNLHIAFVLRDRLTSFVVQCSLLIGGYHWAQEVGPSIHEFFCDELFEDYKMSIKDHG